MPVTQDVTEKINGPAKLGLQERRDVPCAKYLEALNALGTMGTTPAILEYRQ